jgi:hypothetical protein
VTPQSFVDDFDELPFLRGNAVERRIRAAAGDRRAGPDRANPAVRKGGLEPPRELPHWNLNRGVGELNRGKVADSVRQETSGNARERQLSGRSGPVLTLLDAARERWVTGRDGGALRRALLNILRRLEGDDGE